MKKERIRCDVDLGIPEQTKRKLRIWEVSTELLVKERGEKEIACIDNIKMITVYLVSLITIVFSCLLLFAFDNIHLMSLDRITHPLFIHEEGGCMIAKCHPCMKSGCISVTHVLGRWMHECQVSPIREWHLHQWIIDLIAKTTR